MFWSPIARITNRLSPARSEAYAVPIASPSGRLCTNSTPKTRTESRTPDPRRSPTCTSRRASRRCAPTTNTTPASSPRTISTVPPSSRAGFSRPSKDATVIAPIAVPSRIGRKSSAFEPMKKTGSAPSPVARAVALAARTRTTRSTRQRVRTRRRRAAGLSALWRRARERSRAARLRSKRFRARLLPMHHVPVSPSRSSRHPCCRRSSGSRRPDLPRGSRSSIPTPASHALRLAAAVTACAVRSSVHNRRS